MRKLAVLVSLLVAVGLMALAAAAFADRGMVTMVGTEALDSPHASSGSRRHPRSRLPAGAVQGQAHNGGHDPLQAPLRGLRGGRGQHALLAHPLRPGRVSQAESAAFLCGGGDKPPCTPTRGRHSGDIDAATSSARRARGSRPGEMDEVHPRDEEGLRLRERSHDAQPAGLIRGQIKRAGHGHGEGEGRRPAALGPTSRSRRDPVAEPGSSLSSVPSSLPDDCQAELGGARSVDHSVVERERDVAGPARPRRSPLRTTGRSATRPMLRIATSGWLTIGVWKRPASLPALVTVNVEPRSSSGFSVPARAAFDEPGHLGGQLVDRRRVAAADDRYDEAVVGLHGDADVVALEVDDLVAVDPRVQLGELLQRLGAGLEHGRHEELEVDPAEVGFLDPRHGRTSRWARVMCSAISRLTPRSGSRRPSSGPVRPGRPPRTSCSVIRPCGPVPVSDSRSTASSCASLRTSGVARTRPRSCVPGPSPGPGPWAPRTAAGPGTVLADHDEDRADRDDLALLDEDLRDLARGRRRDLDRRLVRLDLDERLVLGDLVPLGHEPAGDLAFGQALAEVGKLELVRHGGGIYRGRPTQASAGR